MCHRAGARPPARAALGGAPTTSLRQAPTTTSSRRSATARLRATTRSLDWRTTTAPCTIGAPSRSSTCRGPGAPGAGAAICSSRRGRRSVRAAIRPYRRTLLAAANLARELADPDRLARAALANTRGYASSADGVDGQRVSVLRAALAAYPVADSPTRAALLAFELLADGDWRLRDDLSDEALGMARRVGDRATLARVLTQCGVARWRAQTVGDIQADLREAEQLAERLEDRQLAALPRTRMQRGDGERRSAGVRPAGNACE